MAWGSQVSTTNTYTDSADHAITLVGVTGAELSANSGALIFTANTTTALSARTFTISFTSTNQAERAYPVTVTPIQSTMNHYWTTNGYQAIVPGMVSEGTGAYATSCTLNNSSAGAVTVDVDVLNSYAGTASSHTSVASIAAGKTARLVFSGSTLTPRTWNATLGGEEAGLAVTLGGGTLSTNYDRYSARITLTGAANDAVTVSCVQASGTVGAYTRAIPVLTPTLSDFSRN